MVESYWSATGECRSYDVDRRNGRAEAGEARRATIQIVVRRRDLAIVGRRLEVVQVRAVGAVAAGKAELEIVQARKLCCVQLRAISKRSSRSNGRRRFGSIRDRR